MRVVLDTNILLVCISDRSPHHWVFESLINREFQLCVTTDVLLEYFEVVDRHMGRSACEHLKGVFDNLPNLEKITTWYRFNLIIKDPDDNKFVDCAIAANADFIVSEDQDFSVLAKIDFPKVKVCSIEEFRSKIAG